MMSELINSQNSEELFHLLVEFCKNNEETDISSLSIEQGTEYHLFIHGLTYDIIDYVKKNNINSRRFKRIEESIEIIHKIDQELLLQNKVDFKHVKIARDIEDSFEFELDPKQDVRIIQNAEYYEQRIWNVINKFKNSGAITSKDKTLELIIKDDELIPNYFSKNGCLFFQYLIEKFVDLNSTKHLKTRLVVVWHFFNNLQDIEEISNSKNISKTKRLTLKWYKEFILRKFKVKITNTDRPSTYNSKYFDILLKHLKSFVETLNTEKTQ